MFISTRAVLVSGVLAGAALVGTANAQPTDLRTVDAYMVTVSSATSLRAGHETLAYKVADLPAGLVLQVDGETTGRLRVVYPAGVPAFVRAGEASLDGATVRLTTPSQLRAANAANVISGSWKPLLSAPMPEGSTMKLVESLKDATGSVQGFLVEAPSGARGFVSRDAVRPATPEEAKSGPVVVAPPPKPAVEPPAPPPSGAVPTVPVATPVEGDGSKPETRIEPTPLTQEPAVRAAVETPREFVRPRDRWLALESAFNRVRQMPPLEAETDELIAEYQDAIDSAQAAGDSRVSAQLEQRLAVLNLQRDLRDRLRALEDQRRKLDENAKKVQAVVDEALRSHVYTMVGELQASTIYDGSNMPLMFRIQSVGTAAPRTIGYLRPDEKLGLKSKLGLVVGVVGESAIDPVLRISVIEPSRVDVLQPSQLPRAVPGAAPQPTPQQPPKAPGEMVPFRPGSTPPAGG